MATLNILFILFFLILNILLLIVSCWYVIDHVWNLDVLSIEVVIGSIATFCHVLFFYRMAHSVELAHPVVILLNVITLYFFWNIAVPYFVGGIRAAKEIKRRNHHQ